MKQKDLITLINERYQKQLESIKSMSESDQRDNPQIIKMRIMAEGKAEALYAVLRALEYNDTLDLRYL